MPVVGSPEWEEAVDCLFKTHHEKEQVLAAALTRGLQQFDQRLDLANSRWQSLLGSMRSDPARNEPASSRKSALKEEAPERSQEVSAAGEEDPETADSPPIPPGVSPRKVLSLDLEQILSDPALNPQRKNPTVAQAAAVQAELVRARSAMEIIDAEVRVELLEGAEMLKAQGEFVEYAPGEKRQTFPGVLTTAEMMPGGGMRIFHFPPDRFPEIYEKKMRKSEIADRSARKLLAMLSDLKGSSWVAAGSRSAGRCRPF